MNVQENYFNFSVLGEAPTHQRVRVSIRSKAIDALYNEALVAQKAETHTYGFTKGDTPLYYIENNFKPHILEHLKELFFSHCVIGYLHKSLAQHKIVCASEPLLQETYLQPAQDAHYTFIIPQVKLEREEKWKRLNLRAPERKNYKDLDRQVELFIKEEQENAQAEENNSIFFGDWVCCDIALVNRQTKQPLIDNYKDQVWIKVSTEEADLELHNLFIGKKIGDEFYTQSNFFQDYLSTNLNMSYLIHIRIVDYIPRTYFSFDHFKRHFQLKTPREMHHKLIEVFSYRNDISQRRETVEATFKLLLKHYLLTVPRVLLEKQRKQVLEIVQTNPDYHVYKAQPDFKERIAQLAEKQLKEMIIADTIAYQENVTLCHDDIAGYLNLIKRPRTKEFVYFDLPNSKMQGQEVPISTEVLKQFCLREKTLNQVIYSLIKKS
jgi:FKBP-type peptidyl-prolyl cis-trans isomerase (trigger factor)